MQNTVFLNFRLICFVTLELLSSSLLYHALFTPLVSCYISDAIFDKIFPKEGNS